MKHRCQISELELQQDNKVADALCDHWKVTLFYISVDNSANVFSSFLGIFLYLQKLRTLWSNRLGELAKDVFLTSVPAQSKLSAQRCEELWLDLERELVAELKQAECTTKLQLEAMRAQLDQDGQVETIWRIINKYFQFNFFNICSWP